MAITKVSRGLLNTGISDSSDATAITIDSSERVGIGVTSPDSKLQIANEDGSTYRFGYGGTSDVYFDASSVQFRTDNGGAINAIMDTDGLKFNGDSAAANALDDYEEGTWTPTLPNGGTVNNNYASVYTKIGRFVNAYCYVNVTATNNSSVFQIGGLPYSGASIANFYGGGSLGYTDTLDVSSWSAPLVHPLNNFLYFHFNTTSTSTVLNSHLGGVARYLMINIIYKTD